MAALLALALYSDVEYRLVLGPSDTTPSAADWTPVYAGALVALLACAALFLRRALAARAAALTALGSLAVTIAYAHLPKHMLTGESSSAEELGLIVLVALAVRSARPGAATTATLSVAAALAAIPAYRDPDYGDPTSLVLGLVCGVAWGLVLRLFKDQRERLAEMVRQQERLALARDLHDTVAQQVTAIVVQTQAVRHVTRGGPPDPQALNEMLAAIEHAGGEALTSMRRLVGSMRDEGERPAPGTLDGVLSKTVEEARGLGLPVRLDLGGQSTADVPGEVVGGLSRVVQEALTNAHRYARGANSVDVIVRIAAQRAELLVEDDGHGQHPGQRRKFGEGYGIVGMRERIELLGGDLQAGPRPGGGWRVRASVPLRIEDNGGAAAPRRGRHAARSGLGRLRESSGT
ncbi:sensor histidine kinase [Streptomyces phaeochromogenes]|uniref:sensor histidine kinase n=1 Tax=Streptomyces phaeochromogenes TaxID=1923 RepID=UPI00367EE4B6